MSATLHTLLPPVLFDEHPLPLLVCDATCEHLVDLNKAAEKRYGFSRSEISSLAVSDFTLELQGTLCVNGNHRHPAVGMPRRYRCRCRCKDGRVLFESLSIEPFNLGDEAYWIVRPHAEPDEPVAQTKSDLQSLLLQVEESKQLFLGLTETTSAIVCLARGQAITYVNSAVQHLLGYTADNVMQMLHSHLASLCPPEYAETVRSIVRDLTQGAASSPTRYELSVFALDGRLHWFDIVIASVSNQGRRSALLLGFDITERKEVERALKESESLFRALADNTSALIGLYRDQKLIYCNRALVALSGYTEYELKHMGVDLFHEEEQAMLLARSAARARGEAVPNRYDARLVTKSGDVRWLDVSVSLTTSNNYPAYLVTAIDITQRKRLAEQVAMHSQHLEEMVAAQTARVVALERRQAEIDKAAAVGHTAARIVHEVNSPLAGIRSAITLLNDSIDKNHPDYHFLTRIDTEIQRMSEIVKQIYTLYQPIHFHYTWFDLHRTVREVVEFLELGAQDAHVHIDVRVEPGVSTLPVNLPEAEIRQVIYNLVQNAVHFSPAGGVVLVELTQVDKSVQISVVDDGPGVEPGVADHIFEPFFSTKGGQPAPGLGLGLAVCKTIVEGLGGTIKYVNRPVKGALFRCTIPMHKPIHNDVEGIDHERRPYPVGR